MPINTSKLIGIIAENGLSQKKVAEKLNISANTFYSKISKGVFGSDEIEIMVEYLNIKDPLAVFFTDIVTQHVTKSMK